MLSVTAVVVACGLPVIVGTPFASTPAAVFAKLLSVVKSAVVNVPAPSIASGQLSPSESVSKQFTIPSLSVSGINITVNVIHSLKVSPTLPEIPKAGKRLPGLIAVPAPVKPVFKTVASVTPRGYSTYHSAVLLNKLYMRRLLPFITLSEVGKPSICLLFKSNPGAAP